MPRNKTKAIHDYVTTLDEAKEVERHLVLVSFLRWGGFALIAGFLVITVVFLFLAVKNNTAPTLTEFTSLLGHISTVVGIAIGAPQN